LVLLQLRSTLVLGLRELENFTQIGAIGRPSRSPLGLLLPVGDSVFRVDVIRPDILRLELSRTGAFEDRPTFATAFTRPKSAEFELSERRAEVRLTTSQLELRVRGPELHIDVFRSDGSAVLRSARAANGDSAGYLVLNDSVLVSRVADASDSIFGLGQKTGPFERRGRAFKLWNIDVLAPGVLAQNRLLDEAPTSDPESTRFDPNYSSIPFFIQAERRNQGVLAAGFFVDNGYRSRFDFSPSDRYRYELRGGAYVEYVLAGPRIPELLEAYTFLTGRMSLPPLWALGHHQCRWHRYDAATLQALARAYRERGIPCDTLWLDIEHMDGHRVFSFHPQRFPEPERTACELDAEGFRLVTIVDPGVKLEAGNPIFEAGKARDLFCRTEAGLLYEGRVWPGRTVFPDFVKEETREFWAELIRRHAARGVAGIWNDMNEPATGAIEPFSMRFDRSGANDPHERWHNQYALLMALATHAGLVAARPTERPFVLTRAGFAGIQRVAAQWLGDHSASFEHLAMGLPMALGLGISGQPFVGGDLPGFAGTATPELAARWFEYAALTPFCRCHHQIDHPDHYPWSFGPEVESIARAALERRYRLLPYLYAAFLRASETGEPVQRPLVFDFQDDPFAASADDEFLLGEALLVAPVLAPGRMERKVYFPAGRWIEWDTGTSFEGEQFADVAAPLGRTPLFVRAGSVVPLLEVAPLTTRGLAPELIELHVFPPAAGARAGCGLLYEDDGQSTAYREGAYLRTELGLELAGHRLRIFANTAGKDFPERRRVRFRVVLHGRSAVSATLDGRSLAFAGNTLVFPAGTGGFTLDVALAPASVSP
jgi:alpha-glucosidase